MELVKEGQQRVQKRSKGQVNNDTNAPPPPFLLYVCLPLFARAVLQDQSLRRQVLELQGASVSLGDAAAGVVYERLQMYCLCRARPVLQPLEDFQRRPERVQKPARQAYNSTLA